MAVSVVDVVVGGYEGVGDEVGMGSVEIMVVREVVVWVTLRVVVWVLMTVRRMVVVEVVVVVVVGVRVRVSEGEMGEGVLLGRSGKEGVGTRAATVKVREVRRRRRGERRIVLFGEVIRWWVDGDVRRRRYSCKLRYRVATLM